MDDRLCLGVDAGGTKTRALLADAHGVVLGVGEAGTGNPQAVGWAAAGAAWREAVGKAFGQADVRQGGGCGGLAGLTNPSESGRGRLEGLFLGVFLGVAGVRTPSEREQAAELALGELSALRFDRGRLLAGGPGVGSDLEIAHAGAFAGGVGVVVIAGTGSAAWGRNTEGRSWQAGGWGWLVDDQGGGYWLALRGLASACEAVDKRGEETELGARALRFFSAEGLRELLRELHAGRCDRAGVAGFAREVCLAADAGDAVALALVEEAGTALLRMAGAVRRQVAPTSVDFPLAVTGGLGLGQRIAKRAQAAGFAPLAAWGDPVLGAVILAAERAGVRLDAGAKTRLLEEWKNRA